MALQTIRYGSGVWKQHEEQRLRLETRVRELERCNEQLTLQCSDAQLSQSQLRSALTRSEQRALELEEQLHVRGCEHATVVSELDVTRHRLAASEECVEQMERDAAAHQLARNQQDVVLADTVANVTRLTQQVELSRDEDARLCDLLYAAQETSAAHEAELARCERDVRVLTRANAVLTRQREALANDNRALAQQLARMRSANPGTVRMRGSSTLLASKTKQQDDESTPEEAQTAQPSNPGSSSMCVRIAAAHASCSCSSSSSAVQQRTRSKLERAHNTIAQLQTHIATLEASEMALAVRFREASAARKRVEQQQRKHVQLYAALIE